jgi:hypothetical protein
MTNWQSELDALMQETIRLTKSAGVEPFIPRAVIEPNRMSPVNLNSSERDQIRQRVANFKARTRSASRGSARTSQPPSSKRCGDNRDLVLPK